MLKGKKIVLGITGSIAAYKAVLLVRSLIKEGAEVKVVMTPAAKDFISPITLSTLSKNPVLIDIFKEDTWANHVMLGRWADMMLVAPLSCNTLAKMAAGICDNLLLSVYLSATCPVMLAPAMDEDMWKHPATGRNLQTLASYGNSIVPVSNGELASGLFGEGRMAEPETIIEYLLQHFKDAARLNGKKVLVTAGPTYEHIDPVRFIGNHSSGKMGVAIAREFLNSGAEVTLVLGPAPGALYLDGLNVVRVQTAGEMHDACHRVLGETDIAVMAAAVADYSPVAIATEKIKKKEESWSVVLKKTPDILKSLGQKKRDDQVLAGFALETHNERENALTKLQQKNADIIVLNSLRDEGAGFGKDTNKVTVFDRKGGEKTFDLKPKTAVAKDIVDYIIEYIHA
ncbi:bifunctional phosphopantothenoylcysteine decarboxylase/phosphopantothenate--cysteine ligase CoaBC [Agriterribacter sp.]|uniref:bifunctional phosphopantothenoylcysteine decarboxylase/phosphopantothenate--cysteine ligase CoaBC n=1 Tax=Agriterribacter sp. TaxID=2821509 RepID=UPI002C6D496E|nr:bifunctional phosphopantothenoylcysteine decarboxylase/phosphopantothenate--cysteine ligase CoaBC [Agriterribacter sp.]HRP54721.1 bifunctional phosphopantothenoylcysteine decarboxylase/phosphopantothenate--cysteine ligase CoaBC [Agriterribacter sp.]